jgi:CCR4-NOT complex subunit CAF16
MANKEASKPRDEADENGSSNAIRVCGMQFAYEGEPPLFADFNLELPPDLDAFSSVPMDLVRTKSTN